MPDVLDVPDNFGDLADAAQLVYDLWREYMAPPPRLTVTQWAEQHRVLSGKDSSEPGPYRAARTPYAREPMDCLGTASPVEGVILMWGAQTSKALALDTPIPTPAGWTTMGQLAVGDHVLGANGRPVRVDVASPVFVGHRCYRVTFSDGATVVCDAGHLWTVHIDRHRRDVRWTEVSTLTADEIAASFRQSGRRHRYAIPVAKPLQLAEAPLPVDPYVLGLWLGDGSASGQCFVKSPGDAQRFIAHIHAAGHSTVVRHQSDGNWRVIIDPREARTHCLRGHELASAGTDASGRCCRCAWQRTMLRRDGRPMDPVTMPRDSLGLRLRALGVFGNKHIPTAYLRASHQQRLALFQGLMDTDGSIDKRGRCSFSNTNRQLMAGTFELAVSLGLKPVICDRSNGRFSHQLMSFTAYRETTPVFRLPRKLDRMPARDGRRASETERRRIVNVEAVPSVPTRCISVSSADRLYLCGRAMVPTHNTTIGSNWLGYLVDVNPGPVMVVQPTIDMAKRFSRQRLSSMIEDSPRLRGKVTENRSRDESNTILHKEFAGGHLIVAGANSAAGLRSMPVRDLFLDEVDAYPADVDGEGDPVQLAAARQTTFARRKRLVTSTPTTKGHSRIEQAYLGSDRCRYHVPCPHCEQLQALEWGADKAHGIKWDRDADGRARLDTVRYVCAHCGAEIAEHHKPAMLAAGVWVPENPAAAGKVRGFHLSSLYSPLGWLSWSDLVAEWEAAVAASRAGDQSLRRVFVNTRLGESFEETGDKADEHQLRRRAGDWPLRQVLPGLFVMTAGVDVQGDRLEAYLWAWGRGMERQLVDRAVFYGDPALAESETGSPWAALTEYRRTPVLHTSGRPVPLLAVAVDTGGHHTQGVYSYARQHAHAGVLAIKGASQSGKAIVGKPTDQDVNWKGQRMKRGVKLWPIGTDTAKSEIYGRLRLEQPGPGYVHLSRHMPGEVFDQLTAERLVTRYVKGHPRLEWVKPAGRRNEALDCAVYALAAAMQQGIERWREGDWERWEQRVAPAVADLFDRAPDPPAPVAAPTVTRGRISLDGVSRYGGGPDRLARHGVGDKGAALPEAPIL